MLLSVSKLGLFKAQYSELITYGIYRCFSRQINVGYNSSVSSCVKYPKNPLTKNKDFVHHLYTANFSSSINTSSVEEELSPLQFEKISDETLDSLTEYFDEIIELATHLTDADVAYGDGVLTVKFGEPHGTYVINRQTPNKQIWLSSPKSGPKRYNFINGKWIYKHDGKTLHELLNNEIPAIVKNQVCFDKCSYSGTER